MDSSTSNAQANGAVTGHTTAQTDESLQTEGCPEDALNLQQADASPIVSLIVPVYNVAPYIEECVLSLQQQTFGNFEAIFVDDGSTDASLQIARAMVGDDARFIFLEQENAGPATARNKGLDRATGTYVMFLDPDDKLVPWALDCLYAAAQEDDLDYVDFTATTFYESREARAVRNEDWYAARKDIPSIMSGPQLFVRYIERGEYSCSLCFHFFKRSLLTQSGLRLNDGMYVHEDELFSPQLIALAARARFLNEPLYRRRVRAASAMTSGSALRSVVQMFVAYEGLAAWMDNNVDRYSDAFVQAIKQRVEELRGLAVSEALTLSERDLVAAHATIDADKQDAFFAFIQYVAVARKTPAPSAAERAVSSAADLARTARMQSIIALRHLARRKAAEDVSAFKVDKHVTKQSGKGRR